MSLIDILFLAAALGIDCLVVSFSQGLIFNSNRVRNSFALALTMGLFQGLMPCIGYLGAGSISRFVEPFSKWLVCLIFLALGIKFIYEAFQENVYEASDVVNVSPANICRKGRKKEKTCCIGLKCLIGLGIATSIDALAAGASLRLWNVPLLLPAIIIGVMSFWMSIKGFWVAILFKKFPSKALEFTGGMILIFLAVKACL